jgi:hypothetical protein
MQLLCQPEKHSEKVQIPGENALALEKQLHESCHQSWQTDINAASRTENGSENVKNALQKCNKIHQYLCGYFY